MPSNSMNRIFLDPIDDGDEAPSEGYSVVVDPLPKIPWDRIDFCTLFAPEHASEEA